MLEDSDLDLGETVQTPIPDIQPEELFSEEEITEPDMPGESEDIVEDSADELDAPLEVEPALPAEDASIALSEEKIEAIISGTIAEIVERVARETLVDVVEKVTRETVSEVAERVTRETVADVAERVITEAIDALKQSLESETD